ncbi:hypothetical protein [Maridesulfovibrio sp.]|uniref:tetratricopeptide repeat protein n=1 Tax=Maridesulfovibrio sp. TaxID=2795000 RepID=UPI0029F4670E|nr:hypothetical protein [Maridesulfovibrio sp.]
MSNESESKILLLKGPTGIGKTKLVTQSLHEIDIPVVHVKVVDYPKYVADNGEYLLKIFKSIVVLAEKNDNVVGIETFLALRNGKHIAYNTAGTIVKQFALQMSKKYLGDEGVQVIKEVLNTDIKNLRQLGDGKPEVIKDEILSYTELVLSSMQCIIQIENIQKIDQTSLEYLNHAFARHKCIKGVFEYTSMSDNSLSCEAIHAALKSTNSNCRIYELQPIAIEELLDGLKDRPEIFKTALTRHYQDQGYNLRVIVDVSILSANLKTELELLDHEQNNSTSEYVIRSLSNTQRFMLGLIIAHGGEVDSDLIRAAIAVNHEKMFTFGVGLNFQRELKDLCDFEYLKHDGHKIRVAHDSITTGYLNTMSNKKYIILANDTWECFYSKVIENNDPFLKTDALYWLPVLYLSSNKLEQLIAMLEQHGRSALNSFSPRRLVDVFKKIQLLGSKVALTITQSRLDALIERQAIVLFDSCLLDEACGCFDQVVTKSLVGKLIYADACVGTERFDTGLSVIENVEECYSDSSLHRPIHVLTGMIKIHAYRTDGQLQQAESTYRKLLSWKEFLDEPLYASLLRYADVGLYKDHDIAECIKLLELGVDLCQKHNLLSDEASAHIALSQHFGYIGDLERAKEELEIAEEISQKVWIERYSITNNQAVLDIMSGKKKEAEAAFQRSLLLATEAGDRLLILCNYLSVGNSSVAEELSLLLEGITDFNEELAKIAQYNLGIFYAEQGNNILSKLYLEEAAKMDDSMDEDFWSCALRGNTPQYSSTLHRLKYKYYLVFIVRWQLSSSTLQSISNQFS